MVDDAFAAGGSPPAVRAVWTVAGDDKALGVTLEIDRAMEESHTCSIQVSTDQGKTWQTVGVVLKEPVFRLDLGQFREE